MKIALVYDRVNKIGGAERILTELFKLYPDAPLYTLVYDPEKAPWAKGKQIVTSFMQKIPFAPRYHEFFPVVPIFAFESFDFSEYDVVISITSTEAKGIITGPTTKHISYILTPTRYLWSHFHQYFSNTVLRMLALPIVTMLRTWDEVAAHRPDALLTISNTARTRIKKYYKRDAHVIYPPVEINRFSASSTSDDFYLIVSRLVAYKKIDIAIEACNRLGVPLKIVGDGLDRQRLEKLAGPTTTFLGNLTDEELNNYYQKCRAVLMPQEEDFGIVAVEALASGKPVVSFARGGVAEIIEPGITGEFFSLQTVDALVQTLEKVAKKTYSWQSCRKRAEAFAADHFRKKFAGAVTQILQN